MQINKVESDENNFIMQENIDYMFGVGGLNRQNQIPFKSPTIIFWNMKMTNGFPSLSNIKNVFMISGINHRLIFNIIKNGRSNIKDINSKDSMITLSYLMKLLANIMDITIFMFLGISAICL